jgi:tail-anchored protein insertion receptor
MYWLPKGWLPWYGEWILAFPYAPRGSVSVQVWTMASGSILAMVIDAVKSVLTLALGKAVNSERKSRQAQAQNEPVKQAY